MLNWSWCSPAWIKLDPMHWADHNKDSAGFTSKDVAMWIWFVMAHLPACESKTKDAREDHVHHVYIQSSPASLVFWLTCGKINACICDPKRSISIWAHIHANEIGMRLGMRLNLTYFYTNCIGWASKFFGNFSEALLIHFVKEILEIFMRDFGPIFGPILGPNFGSENLA